MPTLRRVLIAFTFSLVCLSFSLDAAWGKRAVLPYWLDVDVRSGPSAAPERVRRNLEIELLGELDRVGCFERVERHVEESTDAGELLLRLTIAEVKRETLYDTSLAQSHDPQSQIAADQGLTARVEARLTLELLSLPELAILRQKGFSVTRRTRPTLGSDAKLEVEFQMIDEVVRLVRSWACKTSAKKLAERIDTVRGAAAPR